MWVGVIAINWLTFAYHRDKGNSSPSWGAMKVDRPAALACRDDFWKTESFANWIQDWYTFPACKLACSIPSKGMKLMMFIFLYEGICDRSPAATKWSNARQKCFVFFSDIWYIKSPAGRTPLRNRIRNWFSFESSEVLQGLFKIL